MNCWLHARIHTCWVNTRSIYHNNHIIFSAETPSLITVKSNSLKLLSEDLPFSESWFAETAFKAKSQSPGSSFSLASPWHCIAARTTAYSNLHQCHSALRVL